MSMRDLLGKMTQLESKPIPEKVNSTPKKKVLKKSAVKQDTSSLKGIFNQLSETLALGQKPLPVVGKVGDKTSANTGFLNIDDNSPAGQALQKSLGDMAAQGKAQIVTPTAAGQSTTQPTPTNPGIGNQAGARTGQTAAGVSNANRVPGTMSEDDLDEVKGVESALRKIVPGYGRHQASEKSKDHAFNASLLHGADDNYWDGTPKEPEVRKQEKAELASSTSAMRRFARIAQGKKPFGEDEQLDELSPKTLGNYVKKASADLAATTYDNGKIDYQNDSDKRFQKKNTQDKLSSNYKHQGKRERGINAAVDKLSNSKGEQRPSLKEASVNEKYEGFKKVEKEVAKSGAKDPGAVAAAIGRKKYGKTKFQKAAATGKKLGEGDLPPMGGIDTQGAGLGAGRSEKTLEGKKKEPAKATKKTVKENMSNRIQAARLEGKSHGLKGHSYAGKNYEDMEEGRAYHDGYKEGLDECYGQQPIQGLVNGGPRATVGGMANQALGEGQYSDAAVQLENIAEEIASLAQQALGLVPSGIMHDRAQSYWYAHILGAVGGDYGYRGGSMHSMEDTIQEMHEEEGEGDEFDSERVNGPWAGDEPEPEIDEGNAFTRALASRTGPRTNGGYKAPMRETPDFAFEAWDNQLNDLLNEGISVSISKGGEGPDSVNINATDAESDKLLALVKQAGLGIFGGEEPPTNMASPTDVTGGSSEINSPGGIDIVGDQDDMLSIMKKLSGVEASGAGDYADEEGSSDEEGFGGEDNGCETCGGSPCQCGPGTSTETEGPVDEEETEDQMEFEVAEDGDDDGSANSSNDMQGNASANSSLAQADAGQDEEEGQEDSSEEEVDEAFEPNLDEWANDAGGNGPGTSFEQDIDFMTKVISSGLNKPKSTGQTTAPVVAGQQDRMGYSVSESLMQDWAKLAGITNKQ